MGEFLLFSRRMIRDWALLSVAFLFAVISALGMGVGLLSLVPAVKLILVPDPEHGESLPEIARYFNAAQREWMGIPIEVPEWIIEAAPESRLDGVIAIVGFIAVLTVIGAFFNFMHQYVSITVATRTVANARMEIFRTAMFMPLVRVTTRGASEFIARVIRDSAAVQKGLVALMSKTVAHATQGLVLFAVAILVGKSLTLGALILLPLLAIILRKLGKRIRRGTQGSLRRQEDLLRIATEAIQGLRSVKANTAEGQAIAQFDVVNREAVRQELRARLARALSGPLIETIAIFTVGALVIFAAREIIEDRLDADSFLISLGALGLAGSKFKMIASLVNEIQAASAPARRLLDVLDEPFEEDTRTARPALPRHQRACGWVWFSLTSPGARAPAVRDIDLEIRHGQRVAIVGPNGCGKTTLLSMVPRLLVPDKGRVLIDDVDLATVSLASLRGQMAVVAQETVLFRGSIADNISFGTGHATRAQIEGAARRAHAHRFISEIPGGYDATIAEQGNSLSGGQRQRIAIARAILRDPSVLILDEATSQIDAESEAHITAAINEFGRGRTVLLIAHRLATVIDADRIVVMDAGAIVDQGRHEELLGRCPLYRRLSQTQLISAAG